MTDDAGTDGAGRETRRSFLSRGSRAAIATAAFVSAPAVLGGVARGQSSIHRLILHHALAPTSHHHLRFVLPWARNVESACGGRLAIDVFPALHLGGRPGDLYDQVDGGRVDLAFMPIGDAPGRFGALEAFELPFMAARRAVANAGAVQEFHETTGGADASAVRILCATAQDRGLIHSRVAVRRSRDLHGLRIAAPTRLSAEAMDALGARAIELRNAQLTHSLRQRSLDGALAAWEAVPWFKLHELLRHHADVSTAPALHTRVYVLAANAERLRALPADIVDILVAHSGKAAAAMAARVWDEEASAVEAQVRKRGNVVNAIAPDDLASWRQATQPVTQRWVAAMSGRGIDGAKALASARDLIAKHEHLSAASIGR